MTQPDWDDDRLDAAFHARYDRPAPTTLAHDVHVRIAGTSPARFALPRIGQPWSLAAAAVVVILIGTAIYLPAALSLPGASAGPSALPSAAATSAPGASATPTEQALSGSLFDGVLPIISVREAIALRDAGADDREIAVHGWFTPAPPVSCGGDATKSYDNPVVAHCPDELVWLSEDAGSYVHVTGNRLDTQTPQGPALNPALDGLDQTWFPSLPVPGTDGASTPVDVVFVGHFDDRRATRCAAAAQAACRDRFIVDSVAVVHGVPTNVAPVYQNSAKATSSAADVEAIVGNEAPGSPILSITVVAGPAGIATVEPSLSDGQQGLIRQPTVWMVRVLESERIATYLVVDGSDAIYEMNQANEAILVGGTPPTPGTSSSAGPWPPADALVLELPSVDIGKPPIRVAIVDESSRFVSAMQQDPVTFSPEGRFGATAEPGKSGQVHLAWVGGVCDSQVTITVGADLRSITFDMGPQPDCDPMGVQHELVMNFTGTVDVPAIQVGEASQN